jgi:hypothetical protein
MVQADQAVLMELLDHQVKMVHQEVAVQVVHLAMPVWIMV